MADRANCIFRKQRPIILFTLRMHRTTTYTSWHRSLCIRCVFFVPEFVPSSILCVHMSTQHHDKKKALCQKRKMSTYDHFFCYELTKDINHKYFQMMNIYNSVRYGNFVVFLKVSLLFLFLVQGTHIQEPYDVNFQALTSSNCYCVSSTYWCLILLSVNMPVHDWQGSEYPLCGELQSQDT
jgi:hypothetical protein